MEWSENDLSTMKAEGETVGKEITQTIEQLQPMLGIPIKATRQMVWVTLQTPEALPGQKTPSYRDLLAELGKSDPEVPVIPKPFIDPVLDTRYPWKTVIAERDGSLCTPIEVNALRVGDIAFATISMEVFTEIGMQIKEASPAAVTIFAGYTNGLSGYLPTAEEHALGGYEVELGPLFYRLPGMFAKNSAQKVAEVLKQMISSLF
jgi:hypothetical protein